MEAHQKMLSAQAAALGSAQSSQHLDPKSMIEAKMLDMQRQLGMLYSYLKLSLTRVLY